jgi:hypothetical protein
MSSNNTNPIPNDSKVSQLPESDAAQEPLRSPVKVLLPILLLLLAVLLFGALHD